MIPLTFLYDEYIDRPKLTKVDRNKNHKSIFINMSHVLIMYCQIERNQMLADSEKNNTGIFYNPLRLTLILLDKLYFISFKFSSFDSRLNFLLSV